MKKTIIASALTAIMLTACSEPQVTTSETKQAENVAVATGKAELGSFGVDLSARDESVKPGDDFFMYASGTWYKNYEMPADKTRFGAFSALAERSEEQVKTIIEEIANGKNLNAEEQLIADFYNAYMDVETLNKLGITPIQPLLADIDAISNTDGLTKAFGQSWLTGVKAPIGGGMWFNRLDPNKYEMSMGAGGLGLPDRSYYLEQAERFVKTREAYVAHIADMLKFAGKDKPTERAEAILALETKIAEGHWPREKRRNRDLTLNQVKRDELATQYPGFNWDVYFAETGYKVPQLNISQPEPIKAMIALINSEDLAVWKDYLTYHAISGNASLLSEDIFNTNFEFYGKHLSGQQEPRARWKRAISEMSGTTSLGFAIGKVYVARYFPESSKKTNVRIG